MSWLSLITGLLKLVNVVMRMIKDKQLMDAGEQRQIAKATADIVKTLGIRDAVDASLDGATDAEIDKLLEQDFRD